MMSPALHPLKYASCEPPLFHHTCICSITFYFCSPSLAFLSSLSLMLHFHRFFHKCLILFLWFLPSSSLCVSFTAAFCPFKHLILLIWLWFCFIQHSCPTLSPFLHKELSQFLRVWKWIIITLTPVKQKRAASPFGSFNFLVNYKLSTVKINRILGFRAAAARPVSCNILWGIL